jgi:hypothetical protein
LISGLATWTVAKPCSPGQRSIAGSRHGSSTRAIASTLANGVFRTARSEACTVAIPVYTHVTGWDAFEPALSLAEQADLGDLWQCASQMPPEWYQQDRAGLSRLIETMHKRRSVIRDLITQFSQHQRNPFPNWKHTPQVAVPDLPADTLECRA